MLAPAEKQLEIPVSIETEQALLGAVMLSPDAYFASASIVDADCFAELIHGQLWTRLAEMIEGGRRADPIAVVAGLGKDAENPVGEITMRKYIARLAANAVTIKGAPDYAKTIRDLSQRRRLIAFGQSLAYDAAGGLEEIDIETLIGEADAELAAIRFSRSADGMKWLHDAANESLAKTAENYRSADRMKIGLETGISEIDQMIGPLMGGDLLTILAPSGNGKSAIATQMLFAASKTHDSFLTRPAFFISLEMPAVQVARRVMAALSRVSTRKQRAGSVDPSEYESLADAARMTADHRILFDESTNVKASTIVRKVLAMKRLHNIGCVAIDHIRLIKPEHPRDNPVQTIENAAMMFKDMAKELDIVVILLAQLTRESQKDMKTWRFNSSALYGGDMVRQASDVMLGVVIPTVFLNERRPTEQGTAESDKWNTQFHEWHGFCEIGTLKLRDDENKGWERVPFQGSTMLFGSRE